MKKKDTQAGVKHLLVVLTIVCFAFILLAAFKFINIGPVREGVSWLIVPLQNGVSAAGNLLGERQAERRTANELSAENKRLEEQVKALETQNLRLTEAQDRLEELEELYALDEQYFDYETVAAQVIAKEPGRWYNTFTINRGTSSGISVNMNVLCQEGLAGIVTETGRTWAKVRAVADDATNISAMLLPTGDTCIISGDLALLEEGKLRMSELRTDYNVVTGTRIVTSQISDKYLPGLLIGYVDTVEQDPNHLTKNGKIIPAVDFEHIRSVLVILHTKQAEDEDGQMQEAEEPEEKADSAADSAESASSASGSSEAASASSSSGGAETASTVSGSSEAAPAAAEGQEAPESEPLEPAVQEAAQEVQEPVAAEPQEPAAEEVPQDMQEGTETPEMQ